jgi:hypothetical protein
MSEMSGTKLEGRYGNRPGFRLLPQAATWGIERGHPPSQVEADENGAAKFSPRGLGVRPGTTCCLSFAANQHTSNESKASIHRKTFLAALCSFLNRMRNDLAQGRTLKRPALRFFLWGDRKERTVLQKSFERILADGANALCRRPRGLS